MLNMICGECGAVKDPKADPGVRSEGEDQVADDVIGRIVERVPLAPAAAEGHEDPSQRGHGSPPGWDRASRW
jgi:hypothetical protein